MINIDAAKLTRAERFAAWVSPRWGLRRFGNRCRLEAMARAYEAAKPSRLHQDRDRLDGRSQDQLNQVSAEVMRAKARYLDENHDLANSILNTVVAGTIGRGIRSIPLVRDRKGDLLEGANSAISDALEQWSKRCDVTGEYSWPRYQRLSARSWMRDGEVFTRKLLGPVDGLTHATPIQYSIQALEADYCPMGLNEKDTIRQGIARNGWGAAEKYYFYPKYPSEMSVGSFMAVARPSTITLPLGASASMVSKDKLIEVDARDVDHIKNSDRFNAGRGMSIFASFYFRIDDLKEFEESERAAARIGAAFAFAITKGFDYGDTQTTSAPTWREMDIAPGIIADDLAPGEEVKSLTNERPSNQLTEFRASQVKAMCGAAKAGYSSTAKDYAGSYSAQRQELTEQSIIYAMTRSDFIDDQVWPVYVDFVRMMLLQRQIPDVSKADMRTIFDAEHVGPGVPYIRPKEEVQADAISIDEKIKSLPQVILERTGRNPANVLREAAAASKLLAKLGLVADDAAAGRSVPADDGQNNSETEGETGRASRLSA